MHASNPPGNPATKSATKLSSNRFPRSNRWRARLSETAYRGAACSIKRRSTANEQLLIGRLPYSLIQKFLAGPRGSGNAAAQSPAKEYRLYRARGDGLTHVNGERGRVRLCRIISGEISAYLYSEQAEPSASNIYAKWHFRVNKSCRSPPVIVHTAPFKNTCPGSSLSFHETQSLSVISSCKK